MFMIAMFVIAILVIAMFVIAMFIPAEITSCCYTDQNIVTMYYIYSIILYVVYCTLYTINVLIYTFGGSLKNW